MEEYWLAPGICIDGGKYRIEKVLGDGGFGITYLGYDERLGRKVAIKEFYLKGCCYRRSGILMVYACDEKKAVFEKAKAQFVKEGRVLALLGEQAGVVNVYTFAEENNTAYLVMEYVEGQSLDEYVKAGGGKLSVSRTLAIMKPVIHAMAGIHKRGVIHRDISPDNIMITADRKVKLIDFGAARQYGDYNEDKVFKGGYTPLEQVSENGQVGPYSDIYSVCATMYTCISGRMVTPARERLRHDDLQTFSKLGIDVKPSVEAAVMKGLALYPENRGAQNGEDLYKLLYEEAPSKTQKDTRVVNVVNKMISDVKQDQKNDRKKKRVAGIVIAVGLVALVVLFLVTGGWHFLHRNPNDIEHEKDGSIEQIKDSGSENTDDGEDADNGETAYDSEIDDNDEGIDDGEEIGGYEKTEVGDEKVTSEDLEQYGEEVYALYQDVHNANDIEFVRDENLKAAAKWAAEAAVSEAEASGYSNEAELNAILRKSGNEALLEFKEYSAGWLIYTFAEKTDVQAVKAALDGYVDNMNGENDGAMTLDNCESLGIGVARADDGTYFFAVFYR